MQNRRFARMNRRGAVRGGMLFRNFCVLLLILIAGMTILLEVQLRPVLISLSENRAKLYLSDTVSRIVYEELLRQEFAYDDFVTLQRDGDGVSTLQADVITMNLVRSLMTERVVGELLELETWELKVPVGTLFGSTLFSARGPSVLVRMLPTGSVRTELADSFTSAGINQTRHQLTLYITADVTVIFPGYSAVVEVPVNCVLAETVIVGRVPDAYFDLGGTGLFPPDS